ncbi:MAG TPA: primosomal protein N' [Propionibacterium sp.]|jgi:primosomal protein N' (replication factor Y)|nr:primosomal protein N' [Propionibacterium sp.]
MSDALISADALAPGEGRPIARVAVDMPLPHLDRLFDYLVPERWSEHAQPGVRVRVRFAGQLRDGFILELGEEPNPLRTLSPLERVVSPEPVLTPEVAQLVRAVADHYAGSFADVMRLAVPPRHAATEKADPPDRQEPLLGGTDAGPFEHYPTGPEFVAAVARGDSPRSAWQVAPTAGPAGDWVAGFVEAARAALDSGRGALLIVPDARDLARLTKACAERFGESSFVALSAEDGPAARYRSFLAAVRGQVRLVVGTRAAAYAPVHHLGLVGIWDDGDDLHSEPRAPYPHVRDILALRAGIARCAALFAARHRTCEIEQLIERDWLRPLALAPGQQRRVSPAVRLAADTDWELERDPLARSVRLPRQVFDVMRAGLSAGPVLVQVPRAGFLVVLVCAECRERVRCPHCQGPVRTGSAHASCEWCARPITGWRCPECAATHWRAPVVGAARTAEELGRAFPGAKVIQSATDRVIAEVGAEPALVIATPGAEPVAETGYAAAVLLDTELLLTRLDLRVDEEAHRRWLNAIGLVRPGAEQGTVIAVGPTSSMALQALVRGDPAGFAHRELQDREQAGFTPAVKMITVEGPLTALAEFSAALTETLADLPDLDLGGPIELPRTPHVEEALGRSTMRVPLDHAHALVGAVRETVAIRSAKKLPGALRVRVDPIVVG